MKDKVVALKPAAGGAGKLVKAHEALDGGEPGQARLRVEAGAGSYAGAGWNLSLANRNSEVPLALALEGGPEVNVEGVRWDLEYASLALGGLRFQRSKLLLRAVEELALRDCLFLDAVARGEQSETLYALRTGTPVAPRSVSLSNCLFQGNRETTGSYMLSMVSMYETLPRLDLSDSALINNDTFCDLFVSGAAEVRLTRCFLHKPPHQRQAREQSDRAFLLGIHNPYTRVVLEDCTLVGQHLAGLLSDQSQERARPQPPPHVTMKRCRVYLAQAEGLEAARKAMTLEGTTVTLLKPEQARAVAEHLAGLKPARPVGTQMVAPLAEFMSKFNSL
jgi:hypothetical protein